MKIDLSIEEKPLPVPPPKLFAERGDWPAPDRDRWKLRCVAEGDQDEIERLRDIIKKALSDTLLKTHCRGDGRQR